MPLRSSPALAPSLGALLALAACGDDGRVDATPTDLGLDAGLPGDAEPPDVGRPDLGARDAGPTGRPDAGFADPAIIAQGRTNIGGAQLFVTVRGTLTSTLPPVIVLPTGPMLGHEYLFEPTEFLLGPGGVENPSRLLVYLDPRATGRSSFGALGDADVTVEAHVRDVIGLVEHIDELLEEPREVDFLGHGYGAALAVLYAAEHPERVRRLVLSNPFPASVEDYARWLENAQARLTSSEIERLVELTQFRVCLRDLDLCSQEQWRINGPTWACPENEAVIRDMNFRHIDYRPFGFYINRDLRELEYDWSPQMGRIMDIPSTIIWGPCDPIPESTLMTYTASIAGARAHVVPGSGHFTMTEQPEAFRRIVTGALTD